MSFLRRRSGLVAMFSGVLLASSAFLGVLVFSSTEERPAQAAIEPDLPTERPRRDLPRALDGTAFDAARIGDWVVVGGDFTQIELQDGSVINQTGAYAYHIDTGALNELFRPLIVKNSGDAVVLAVEPGVDGSTVYLGGKFGTVDGHAAERLAKISVDTGAVDTGFDADVSGPVRDVALHEGSLYLGGEFESVGGQPHGRLAKVDAGDGTVDQAFQFDIAGSTRVDGEPFGPKYVAVTDDGVLVVAHRAKFVNTEARTGIALVDISSNTLLGWSTDFWGVNSVTTIDAEVSPDGTYLVVVGNGGDFPFMGRDAAMAFSLQDLDGSAQEPLWIARNFDSTYAVGISDDAVYVGGHFCWVESSVAPDPWPGDGEFTNNNSCHGTYPAGRFAPEVVYRDQIAALDPVTGHALTWDPGSNALEGVQSIEVIDRGLLIGHDGTHFGRDGKYSRSWNVGRHVFLDLDEPNTENTSLYIDSPVLGDCNGLAPTITGTTRDDVLIGTTGSDVFLAGPGSDVVWGGDGNDVICGGDGVDALHGQDGDDLILGGAARDRIYGGRGHDELRGEDGRDILVGDAGRDLLVGGKRQDRLNGRGGDDELKGQVGPDRIQGGPGSDLVVGGAGFDTCAGGDFDEPADPGDSVLSCED